MVRSIQNLKEDWCASLRGCSTCSMRVQFSTNIGCLQESGEESDHDSARPRHNVHDHHRQGVNNRYRPRPAHGPERGGNRRSNWRGYGRGEPGRRQQGRSGERHDRNGHVPRPRHQHRPAPPRRDTVKRDVPATAKSRSASRERQLQSRENSCSLEQHAPKQDVAGTKVHQVELGRMQQLITLDTVGVAAAKQCAPLPLHETDSVQPVGILLLTSWMLAGPSSTCAQCFRKGWTCSIWCGVQNGTEGRPLVCTAIQTGRACVAGSSVA